MISKRKLKDTCWYTGKGRNSSVGLWDAKANCFWVISVSDFQNPKKYPEGSKRSVRLKREDYFSPEGGTFKPEELVTINPLTDKDRRQVHRRMIAKIKAMTPEERMQTMVRAGIYTKDGRLNKKYGGNSKRTKKKGSR